jgi:GNAT superfamily N-acetyltransferase
MDAIIRKFEQKDERELKKLILEFKKFEGQYEAGFLLDEAAVEELYKIEINGDGKFVYVATIDKDIVAFISFEKSMKNDPLISKEIDVVYISGLFVSEECRGKGIATELMKIATDWAKLQNIKYLKLLMFTKNELARKYYFSQGFDDYESTMIREI